MRRTDMTCWRPLNATLMTLLLCACGNSATDAQPPAPQSVAHDNGPTTPAVKTRREGDYRLIMLGDSITAGSGLPASEALPVKLEHALIASGVHATVIGAGVSGDTTAGALVRIDWVLGAEADGVLIALGGNDLLQGIDPARTQENLRKMIKTAKAHGANVILAGMRASSNYGEDYRAEFDAIYPRLAKEEGVALYPFLLEGIALDPALNQRDGIHPNEKGVAVIVDKLAPFLAGEIVQDTRLRQEE